MTLKNTLLAFKNAWTALQTKIKTKIQTQTQTITQTTQKFNESNSKLELQMKENTENEKVLDILLKDFEKLSKELDA